MDGFPAGDGFFQNDGRTSRTRNGFAVAIGTERFPVGNERGGFTVHQRPRRFIMEVKILRVRPDDLPLLANEFIEIVRAETDGAEGNDAPMKKLSPGNHIPFTNRSGKEFQPVFQGLRGHFHAQHFPKLPGAINKNERGTGGY
jgi:hypothetical protein